MLVSCAALSGNLVYAQEPKRETVTLEEVIVTAQKREESLLDVPLNVTAVTAADIEARGVTSLQDMQYSVPGLTMAETGPGAGRLQINGIGIAGGSTGLPAVGRYLDEMPITASAGGAELDLRLLDMQRVEVLHGPQPTLYGEGSMGGTIHFVTASPDLQEFGGNADGSWGKVKDGSDSYRVHGVLNAPLITDKLGLRLLAGYEKDGGWVDSLFSGRKDVNGVELKTFRAKLLYKPIENLSISLLALHQQHDQGYQNFGSEQRTTAAAFPVYNRDKYDLGNLVATWKLGSVTLLNSTGYFHREPQSAFDLTNSFLPFLPLLGIPPSTVDTIQAIGYPLTSTHNAFTEELRLSSNGSGPFNYVLGAYYRDYRTSGVNRTVTAPGTLPFDLLNSSSSSSSKTWAAFGEVRYAFNDRLEALLGLRHFHEKQENTQTGLGAFDAPGTVANEGQFNSNNPRLNLSYKTSQSGLAYVNVAKGFRSGQFNSGAAPGGPVPLTVGPETLWTYEVGAKQEWLDRRLITELSVYHNTWKDIQVLAVLPNNPNGFLTNSGKASGEGVNLALSALPASGLVVSATLGYTDMKYDTNSPGRFEGDPLDLVSKWTYSAALDYRHPLASASTLVSRLDFGHTGGYVLTIRDFPTVQKMFPTGARNVLNARVGVDFGKYQANLFADNLTDDNGSIYPALPPPGSFPDPVLPTPRTIGVEVRVAF